jgi:hypothetical protein
VWGVYLSTLDSVNARVYLFPQSTVWTWGVYPCLQSTMWTWGCIPVYSQQCGLGGCIPVYSQQCGLGGVSLSTVNSVDARVYPFHHKQGVDVRVYTVYISTACSVDVQGVSIFHRQHRRGAGCISCSVDVQCVSINSPCRCAACSVDVQGVSVFHPNTVEVQGVSLSTACCMDVQGVSNLHHHRSVDEPRKQCGRASCIHLRRSVKWRLFRVYPSSPQAV